MAIGRISGSVLKSNLTRNGVDLAFETNLLYLDVTNSRVGIGTSEPSSTLQVSGTTTTTGLTANGAINIDGTGTSNMDNVIIGANTATTITGTTITGTSIVGDGVTITDNTISTNASNANLELSGNGTGTVSVSGFKFPTADGSTGQFIKTDGNGNLGFATASATLNHSDINDNITTVATSATTEIDLFDSATYRSAKYYISISDQTNGRFEIVEANLIHGPSADSTIEAYLTTFGSTTSHSEPLCTFSADIDDGNVRLLATNITSDSTVFKFQRTLIDL